MRFPTLALASMMIISIFLFVDGASEPLTGDLIGTVIYDGGPFNGTAAGDCNITITNGTDVYHVLTAANGSFGLYGIPFRNYTLTATPVGAVSPSGELDGYVAWTEVIEFNSNLTITVRPQYHDFIPPTKGSISGSVFHSGGPDNGTLVEGANISVHNATGAVLASVTTGSTGSYSFEGIPFGDDLDIRASPPSPVEEGGKVSGYYNLSILMDLREDALLDLPIPYYVYVTPTEGPISGRAKYKDGPNDTQPASGTEVALINETGSVLLTTVTNATGHYIFETAPFGINHTIRFTPPDAMLGEQGVRTGYKEMVTSAFVHDDPGGKVVNVSLNHYVYEPPSTTHPRVRIFDIEDDPLADVLVSARIGNDTYNATSDGSGWAVFRDLDGDTFPPGTRFTASMEGYETVSWDHGDPIPGMRKERGDDTIIVIVLLFIIALVIVVLLGLALKGDGKDGQNNEE